MSFSSLETVNVQLPLKIFFLTKGFLQLVSIVLVVKTIQSFSRSKQWALHALVPHMRAGVSLPYIQ